MNIMSRRIMLGNTEAIEVIERYRFTHITYYVFRILLRVMLVGE